MVLPLGPVWGRLDEAAHLRLSLDGPAIRRAESLLGFTHKGTLALMRGKSPRTAARFAARLSGDATVAHSVAFAQAAEFGDGRRGSGPSRGAADRHDGGRTDRRPSRQSRRGRPAGGCRGRANALRRAAGRPAARVGCGVRPSADDGLRRARRGWPATSPTGVPRCSCGRWARSPRSWSRSAGCTTPPALVVAAVRPGPGGRRSWRPPGRSAAWLAEHRDAPSTRGRCSGRILAHWHRDSPSAQRAMPRPGSICGFTRSGRACAWSARRWMLCRMDR